MHKKQLPGIALCLLVAIPAWFLGRLFPVIGGPVFAIVIGIVIATSYGGLWTSRFGFSDGVTYTAKKLLQYAIILLGFEMNLFRVLEVGKQSLFVMLFTLAAAFLTAFLVGRALQLPGNTTTLIGVGTAICGGSAIAATAPVIRAREEEVSRAISTIFLFNLVAVFLFPWLGQLLGMSDTSFGMFAGTAINDTSAVVAAGTAWSSRTGSDTALQLATIVKLARTLVIVPIALFLAVYTAKKQKAAATTSVSISKIFPWFVLLFLVAALIHTVSGMPDWLAANLVLTGKFLIVMAMAAIGLKTNLKTLLANGYRPILLGLCCWFAVAVTSLSVQRILGL